DRLEAFLAHRHLDDDVRGERGKVAALVNHATDIPSDDLGAHRARRDGADLLQYIVVVTAHLGEESGIGGNAIEHTPSGSGADLIDFGSIQKDLHGLSLCLTRYSRS